MRCGACGTENPDGHRFCGGCGASLARICPSCGATSQAEFAFCGHCGSSLEPTANPAPANPAPPVADARPERRLVSILFADLVGHTTRSEGRDAEDVRELLSAYFDRCRAVIGRYGGRVEKFIGDAVMAVWGAPVANEDDAERAVRAALELVDAVRALGASLGIDDLAARAAVLTGEAAVNLAATEEGLVAGDLVNSASRVQSLADPGTVLVDDATRRATNSAIAFVELGEQELRGKSQTMALSRAARVIAGARGAQKAEGLEAPFVGRLRELDLMKDLLHATADRGVAQLTSVTGIAGIGKSRLAWELFKYVDGVEQVFWWHRGRCLPYGDGVTYWALAEMIRSRAGIQEEEPAATAEPKLLACVQQFVSSTEEQDWVLPRLASLLGYDDGGGRDASDLFSGWRLFFERMSEQSPVLLVFEDLHWADSALLDFIEYLLDWSRNHPIYVVVLARPELAERRPTFASGRNNVTVLSLNPLSDEDMNELLEGLVPGLPDQVGLRIRERAEGVPLYAVETVRMLVDRGLLVREADRYVPTGTLDDLDVPETLHALIAARLDGLPAGERALLQQASVLGKTFPASALASVADQPEAEVDAALRQLVRKELLGVQADPRSPQRGQYAFLQSLVQKVAYDTLGKRDRRSLHLAAAAYLQRNWAAEEGEVVEVIAAHYLDAWLADPDAPDAATIRSDARDFLTRAGDRAAGLAAQSDARRYFARAAELADDDATRAELLLRAGTAASDAGMAKEAGESLEMALQLFDELGDPVGRTRTTKELAFHLWTAGSDIDRAIELLRRAAAIAEEVPPALRADTAALLGRLIFFHGDTEEALPVLDGALVLAEAHRLLPALSDAMNTKGLVLHQQGRAEEAQALLEGALRVAREAASTTAEIRALGNLAFLCGSRDAHAGSAEYDRQALEIARRVGSRTWEWFILSQLICGHRWDGSWDEAAALFDEVFAGRDLLDAQTSDLGAISAMTQIRLARGDEEGLEGLVAVLERALMSADVQDHAMAAVNLARIANVRGDHERALELAREALAAEEFALVHPELRLAAPAAIDAALQTGRVDEAAGLLADFCTMPVGLRPPFLRAHLLAAEAFIDAARGRADGVEDRLRAAVEELRSSAMPVQAAEMATRLAEWLIEQGERTSAAEAAADALDVFQRVRAQPWIDRVNALGLEPVERSAILA